MSAITLTFGEHAENHKGMEILGDGLIHINGLLHNDLRRVEEYFKNLGARTNLISLVDLLSREEAPQATDAYILIIKNGVKYLGVDPDEVLDEQNKLETDKHAFMYGRVVNKLARHNLCFADFEQEPDYENRKGRVYNFSQLPLLKHIRDKLPEIIGAPKVKNLFCEGNYYYDLKKTYIGFHGDSEHKIAIGIRLGESFNLYFQWFYQGTPRGDLCKLELEHGDIYMMCQKAIGTDWKTRNDYTLRHAAAKYPKLIGIVERC